MLQFSRLIDAYRPAAGDPPRRLLPFVDWAVKGAWRVLAVAAFFGSLVGVGEILSAFLIGWVIDDALAHGQASYMAENWPVLLAVAAFYLILRPAVMGTSAAMNSLAVGPNVAAMVLSRLNGHLLRQHVQYFDDDFAGRLAQKEMQTARAISEVAVDTVMTMFFALTTLIGAGVLMATVDLRLAGLLAIWLMGYAALIRWFLPRIRARAKARAGARAAVTGQLVDTLTNMKTVKLFAHTDREGAAAHAAIDGYREAALGFGRMAVGFRAVLNTLAGALPVLMIGGSLFLWQAGLVSAGEIATAGIISSRIGQMTGFVSFTAMSIFSNVGEIEDGMRTLSPEPEVQDRPGAAALPPVRGEIRFDGVSFHYGRKDGGGLNGLSAATSSAARISRADATRRASQTRCAPPEPCRRSPGSAHRPPPR